ncbi:MAG: hypothetical protein HYW70_01430 [Candidatus Nealsonbacteria bacterium]|nr:hypothetical protein [Candidatus Nealsonbacteria bacterium]
MVRKTQRQVGRERTERGRSAEKRAVQILEHFKTIGKKFPGRRIITNIEWITQGSQEDKEGKDIILSFDDGLILPLQIKNWRTEELEKKYSTKGICFIEIRLRYGEEEWHEENVFNAISRFLAVR